MSIYVSVFVSIPGVGWRNDRHGVGWLVVPCGATGGSQHLISRGACIVFDPIVVHSETSDFDVSGMSQHLISVSRVHNLWALIWPFLRHERNIVSPYNFELECYVVRWAPTWPHQSPIWALIWSQRGVQHLWAPSLGFRFTFLFLFIFVSSLQPSRISFSLDLFCQRV